MDLCCSAKARRCGMSCHVFSLPTHLFGKQLLVSLLIETQVHQSPTDWLASACN